MAGAGDVNGDGYADVIVGVPTQRHNGQAYVYLGGAPGFGDTPAATLTEPGPERQLGCRWPARGTSTATATPTDRRRSTIAAATGAGRAYVYLGGAAGLATRPP